MFFFGEREIFFGLGVGFGANGGTFFLRASFHPPKKNANYFFFRFRK